MNKNQLTLALRNALATFPQVLPSAFMESNQVSFPALAAAFAELECAGLAVEGGTYESWASKGVKVYPIYHPTDKLRDMIVASLPSVESPSEEHPARSAERTAHVLRDVSQWFGTSDVDEALRREMITALVTLTYGDDDKRHAITSYIFGKPSTKDLTHGEARAIVDWCGCRKAGDRYVVTQAAATEARAILAAMKSGRIAA